MGSDIARISHDEKQHYRAVVGLQGRAMVEADWNEQSAILTEETRHEALDFVGPSGSPDGGYTVTFKDNDLEISAGTLYVGGHRVTLDDALRYADQVEVRPSHSPLSGAQWLDYYTSSEAWEAPGSGKGLELVYLLLREQEIGAVEDHALLEEALGGPDTSGRKRLLQRVVRFSTTKRDCDGAVAEVVRNLGLNYDKTTKRLTSGWRLKSGFETPPEPSAPCQPTATGGYLGADNQMIRVKVLSGEGGTTRLCWSYDNASFLYRIAPKSGDDTTVILSSAPVDSFHQPVKGQAVEVLPAAARLANGQYAAAADGLFRQVESYDPDSRQLKLDHEVSLRSEQLFLRVWQKQEEGGNTPVPLGDTGVTVTLTPDASGKIRPGDFWTFAVRPASPTEIYPQRYSEEPQPPEGPRLWLCPLAIVDWDSKSVVTKCVDHFDNLVELTNRKQPAVQSGCCTITVTPNDDLVSVVQSYVKSEKVTICLTPGEYMLKEPLILGPEHSNLTLQGCHDGTVIKAAPEFEDSDRFAHGLIVLWHAENVTLRQLRFQLPLAPLTRIRSNPKVIKRLARAHSYSAKESLISFVSIGVTSAHCAEVTIERCVFRFTIEKQRVLGIGVYAISECWGVRISGCRFLKDEMYLNPPLRGEAGILVGYALTEPAAEVAEKLGDRSILEEAAFEGNRFSGLDAAAVVSNVTCGTVRIENNTVRDCVKGFLLTRGTSAGDKKFPEWLLNFLVVARDYPLPPDFLKWLMERAEKKLPAGKAIVKEIPEVPTPEMLSLSLHVINNDIDATIAGVSESGAAALTVVGELNDVNENLSRVVITSNVMRAASDSVMVAAVENVCRCSITGNVIFNEASEGTSLRVQNIRFVAVTGNVLGTPYNIPEKWVPMNQDA